MRIEAESQRQIPFLEELDEYLRSGEHSVVVERIKSDVIVPTDLNGKPLLPAVGLLFQLQADYSVPVPEGFINVRRMGWFSGKRDMRDKSAHNVRFLRGANITKPDVAIINASSTLNLASDNLLVEPENIVSYDSGRYDFFAVVKRVLMRSAPVRFKLSQ